MKQTIVKINKTKTGSLRKQTKLTKLQPDEKNKKRRIKSTKLEIKRRDYNRQCRNTKDYMRLL